MHRTTAGIQYRTYGAAGPWLTLLHGGPGAPGELADLASALAAHRPVLEPFERRAGDAPLTVGGHVADLDALLHHLLGDDTTTLLGFSSGAITALTFAARHPTRVAGVVLVGSATFTPAARAAFRMRLAARLDDEARRALDATDALGDEDARIEARAAIVMPYYFTDPIAYPAPVWVDGRGHDETWADMLRLQQEGTQPAEFASIRCPVLMLHGTDDPHPGTMTRDDLGAVMPQLEYVELERCGHYPWLERAARKRFFAVLLAWLRSTAGA